MNDEIYNNDFLLQKSKDRLDKILANDPKFQTLMPSENAMKELQDLRSCHPIEYFAKACELYSERPVMGSRAFEVIKDDSGQSSVRYLQHFTYFTYNDLWTRVVSCATGYSSLNIAKPKDLIGIFGYASPDYVVIDLACLYLGAISVPLQTTLSTHDLCQIIKETELSCLVCGLENFEKIISLLPACPSVNNIVVMDVIVGDENRSVLLAKCNDTVRKNKLSVRVWILGDIEKHGHSLPPVPKILPPPGQNPLVKLLYTSGSTGLPKGAMYPESIWLQYFKHTLMQPLPTFPQIGTNYMPLNHIAGQWLVIRGMLFGGIINFTLKSDMSTLFEDIELTSPTILMLVPRISSMIYQQYQLKVALHLSGSGGNLSEAREKIMEEMGKTILGNRLLSAYIGTAPTAPEIVTFLKQCFQVPILNAYGSTEAGAITTNNKIDRLMITDYKLVDVHELGYHLTDKPYPRGELRIKSNMLVPGYYKNPAATQDLFDHEGYFKTGDIVEEQEHDHLVWIDRLKNIVKLSQGEFVGVTRLEGVYEGNSPLIKQIYLYGNSERAYLLAVIVIDSEGLAARVSATGKEISREGGSQLFREELNRIAKEQGLNSYEIPRDFILEQAPFTVENGLLTESNKPARSKLKAKYAPLLEALYEKVEQQRLQEIKELGIVNSHDGVSISENLRKAVKATLGITDFSLTSRFVELGGDSLSAITLVGILEKLCAVTVPPSIILNPSGTFADIVNYIEKSLDSSSVSSRAVTFASVHGLGAKHIKVEDFRLQNFFSEEELQDALALRESMSHAPVKTVLLTGSNGFLGRFLTLNLLSELPTPSGKLYCLVRAPNDEIAYQRLCEGFGAIEEPLKIKLRDWVTAGSLVVMAGDLMKPNFGLPLGKYEQLAFEVDSVFHNGALVNHAYSYNQLFEPNVIGTIEVIRFAIKNRLKRINFISSIAVPSLSSKPGPVFEDEDPRIFCSQCPTEGGYASGYAASKWAAEVILHNLHSHCGIPVNVFRCGMILAHSEAVGQINAADFFSRLLCGVVFTGVAPSSFYETSSITDSFDGLPIDFISSSIVKIGLKRFMAFHTYHVTNPHSDDRVSFDVIVDWITSAGYPVERIEGHSKWYSLFKERLTALDEKKRQHSPLPIISMWERPLPPSSDTQISGSRFQKRLSELSENDLVEFPHLTEKYIHKCLQDLSHLGIF